MTLVLRPRSSFAYDFLSNLDGSYLPCYIVYNEEHMYVYDSVLIIEALSRDYFLLVVEVYRVLQQRSSGGISAPV